MLKIVFLLFTVLMLFAKDTIRFAPLPMRKSETLLKQYALMINWLQKRAKVKIDIVYVGDYAILLKKLKNKEIDMAFLGPLPYIKAKKLDKNIVPIVRFLNKNGKDRYTCSLFCQKDKQISSIKDIKNSKFALTQKLSTCGYFAMENILQSYGNSLNKNNNSYQYTGSHTKAILYVIMQKNDFGGAKTSIVDDYAKRFHLKTIAKSKEFPGFLLVAQSKTVPIGLIRRIKNALLSLKPLKVKRDAIITKKWGKNIKYGCTKAQDKDYDSIREMIKKIKIVDELF